jgi:hypothetical protein
MIFLKSPALRGNARGSLFSPVCNFRRALPVFSHKEKLLFLLPIGKEAHTMQTIYQGRYHFTRIPGHLSWCNLRVLQGKQSTLVIFMKAVDNPGTLIAIAAELLATQVVATYHLDPDKTVFLEYTPPQSREPDFILASDDELKPAERFFSPSFGASAEQFERISFHWLMSHHLGGKSTRWLMIHTGSFSPRKLQLNCFVSWNNCALLRQASHNSFLLWTCQETLLCSSRM